MADLALIAIQDEKKVAICRNGQNVKIHIRNAQNEDLAVGELTPQQAVKFHSLLVNAINIAKLSG